MSRINIPTVEQSPESSKPLLAAVAKQLGMVPNLMRLVGNSPAALEGYLSLNGALAKASIDTALRERIALTVGEFNGCEYCLSAHDFLGRNFAKLSGSEIDAARAGRSSDARVDAALRFARRVVVTRGMVTDEELSAVRAAGFDDAAVLEIVVTVALNVLTNYVNNVARTDVDFPKIAMQRAA